MFSSSAGSALHSNFSIRGPLYLLDSRLYPQRRLCWCHLHVYPKGKREMQHNTHVIHVLIFVSQLSWCKILFRKQLYRSCCRHISDGTACQPVYMDQRSHSDLFLTGFGFWITYSFCQLQPIQQQL